MAAAALSAVLLLAGCGGTSVPPEAVVRAWSDAVNSGDYARAGKLLADGAVVIEGDSEQLLRTREDAERWSRSRPCGGLVQTITTHRDIVTATFLLSDRGAPGGCAAAGGTLTAEFQVRRKLIVFFRRLSGSPPPAAAG